ncbi:MAG TPA: LCP family protein, partial [Anaerolineales bacterium]|nr:LCP family protein [Anaerolineales bacterium]
MKIRAFFLTVCFALFACSLFTPPPVSVSPTPVVSTPLLSGPKPPTLPQSEPTPASETPILDSIGDGIFRPDPPRKEFPLPSENPAIPLPTLADVFPLPAGTVNVLLLGSDERGPYSGVRTDTILLVSFHPKQGKVTMISFPRDMYVYIPGWTVRRINEAYQHGGFDLLADTFDYNFGIRPDHYVLVNFNAFQQAVDSLGGIDVQVGKALRESGYSVKPGVVHMDGEMALWYVRSRYTTSDFDRMTRQQEVLVAIFQQLISMDALKQVPQMYHVYQGSVVTNISLQETLNW